jgi:hypothetical protein
MATGWGREVRQFALYLLIGLVADYAAAFWNVGSAEGVDPNLYAILQKWWTLHLRYYLLAFTILGMARLLALLALRRMFRNRL